MEISRLNEEILQNEQRKILIIPKKKWKRVRENNLPHPIINLMIINESNHAAMLSY